jgi:hypothetical protein
MAGKLPKRRNNVGKLRDKLVRCPANCINGFMVSGRWNKQDGRCPVCHGLKFVSLVPCRCGRPRRFDADGVVRDAKGKIVEGIWCCGMKECKEALVPKVQIAQEVYVWSGNNNYTPRGGYCYPYSNEGMD